MPYKRPVVTIELDEYNFLKETEQVHNQYVKEFHNYCQEHLLPEVWGKNVYKAVLDDAIRMRREIELKKLPVK